MLGVLALKFNKYVIVSFIMHNGIRGWIILKEQYLSYSNCRLIMKVMNLERFTYSQLTLKEMWGANLLKWNKNGNEFYYL
jgi:hypothetical protein